MKLVRGKRVTYTIFYMISRVSLKTRGLLGYENSWNLVPWLLRGKDSSDRFFAKLFSPEILLLRIPGLGVHRLRWTLRPSVRARLCRELEWQGHPSYPHKTGRRTGIASHVFTTKPVPQGMSCTQSIVENPCAFRVVPSLASLGIHSPESTVSPIKD